MSVRTDVARKALHALAAGELPLMESFFADTFVFRTQRDGKPADRAGPARPGPAADQHAARGDPVDRDRAGGRRPGRPPAGVAAPVHRGNLLGVPATGARVETTGITIFRFAGDLIAEEWTEFDGLGPARPDRPGRRPAERLGPTGRRRPAARSAKVAAGLPGQRARAASGYASSPTACTACTSRVEDGQEDLVGLEQRTQRHVPLDRSGPLEHQGRGSRRPGSRRSAGASPARRPGPRTRWTRCPRRASPAVLARTPRCHRGPWRGPGPPRCRRTTWS
jgi:hypothetical protein